MLQIHEEWSAQQMADADQNVFVEIDEMEEHVFKSDGC